MPGARGTIVKISDVIFSDKNEWQDVVTALYLSTLLLRNISAGRGGAWRTPASLALMRPRQEECGEFEANWTTAYILFKSCIHSVMFTWTTKLPNHSSFFLFKVYIATWCTEPHKNKRLPWTEGWGVTHQEESGGFPFRCCLDTTMSVTEPLASALPVWQWVVSEAESGTCSLGSSRHSGAAGGKLVICSSLSQHSEEIVPRQHLEESEVKDILGRLRALFQRLGQNKESIC